MVELDNQLNIKNVKIADFGSAKLFVKDANEQHTEKVGTPMYAAPEVMTEWGDGKYGPAVDTYSAGVTMLRVGLGSDYDEALEKEAEVSGCIGVFPTTFFSSDHVVRKQTISSFLGEFPDATIVKEMVGLAPEDRPSAEVILTNKWLRNGIAAHARGKKCRKSKLLHCGQCGLCFKISAFLSSFSPPVTCVLACKLVCWLRDFPFLFFICWWESNPHWRWPDFRVEY